MKNLISISVLLLFVLTGCSKDETSEDSNSSNFLVGKWEITAYIDENNYAWNDEEGFYVFSNERVHVQFGGDTYDESEATEYVYEYLPDSNELIWAVRLGC